MSLSKSLAQWPAEKLESLYATVTEEDVLQALSRDKRDVPDLVALLSPLARPHLEAMAREAQRLTRWHFGRTISLYAPLYISNLCAADCVYCGYAARSGSREKRVTLRPDDVRRECAALAEHGFDQVLILTGESPKIVTVDYIARSVEIAREFFNSVSVEVYALDEPGYGKLVSAGLEGVTLYMETYHRPTYAEVHLLGEKADYDFRLAALDRAGRAGVRKLNLGALLGLYDWRFEAVWTALHAWHLQRTCWQSALGISFPRLLHTPERYHIENFVSDAQLVQIMLAMRLAVPEAGINLSTREAPAFRDKLIPLGVTHMSAGSSTQPGGYATYKRGEADERTNFREVLEQFEIEDHRDPADVVSAIRATGYDPVWKDYDRVFDKA